jgi:hypothetical protein
LIHAIFENCSTSELVPSGSTVSEKAVDKNIPLFSNKNKSMKKFRLSDLEINKGLNGE